MSAEYCGWHIQQQVVNQVIAIAHQILMLLFLNQHKQISRNSSARCGITLALNRNLHTSTHAGRNLNGDNFLITHNTFAAAMSTLILDYLSFAVASRTCFLHLHHAEDAALGANDATGTFTSRTCFAAATVSTACAVTVFAFNKFLYFNLFLNAGTNLFQCQAHFNAQVSTTTHTLAAATSSSAANRSVAKLLTPIQRAIPSSARRLIAFIVS